MQSAADFSITMLAGGKHTAIKEGAAPYNYDLKVLYKSEFVSITTLIFNFQLSIFNSKQRIVLGGGEPPPLCVPKYYRIESRPRTG